MNKPCTLAVCLLFALACTTSCNTSKNPPAKASQSFGMPDLHWLDNWEIVQVEFVSIGDAFGDGYDEEFLERVGPVVVNDKESLAAFRVALFELTNIRPESEPHSETGSHGTYITVVYAGANQFRCRMIGEQFLFWDNERAVAECPGDARLRIWLNAKCRAFREANPEKLLTTKQASKSGKPEI